jgi:hypothetical protein
MATDRRARLAGQPTEERDGFHPSHSNRSLAVRHHTLRAERRVEHTAARCQRMNDNAARRNGRCRGARPVGPWNTRAISARRAARIVAQGRDLHPSRGERVCRVAHREE